MSDTTSPVIFMAMPHRGHLVTFEAASAFFGCPSSDPKKTQDP